MFCIRVAGLLAMHLVWVVTGQLAEPEESVMLENYGITVDIEAMDVWDARQLQSLPEPEPELNQASTATTTTQAPIATAPPQASTATTTTQAPIATTTPQASTATTTTQAPIATTTPQENETRDHCEGDEHILNATYCRSIPGCTWDPAGLDNFDACHCDYQGCCSVGGCYVTVNATTEKPMYSHSCSDFDQHISCCEPSTVLEPQHPDALRKALYTCPGTCKMVISGQCDFRIPGIGRLNAVQAGCWLGWYDAQCGTLMETQCIEPGTNRIYGLGVAGNMTVLTFEENDSVATLTSNLTGITCDIPMYSSSGIYTPVDRPKAPTSFNGFATLPAKACSGNVSYASLQDALVACRSSSKCFGVHNVGCITEQVGTFDGSIFLTCDGEDSDSWQNSLQCCQTDCTHVKEQDRS